ncbi:hypothetical protein BDR04DRAFT_1102146 [Suillus decipiens]|nr:hypothetical protein BDR04DRAFT_1102146 [Suillus decipiens]
MSDVYSNVHPSKQIQIQAAGSFIWPSNLVVSLRIKVELNLDEAMALYQHFVLPSILIIPYLRTLTSRLEQRGMHVDLGVVMSLAFVAYPRSGLSD